MTRLPPSAESPTPNPLVLLLFNHFDAWVVASVSCAVGLMVHGAWHGRGLTLLAAVGFGYWLAFALNDYYDAPADAQDPRKQWRNFFVRYPLRPWQFGAAVVLLCVPLAIVFSQFGWRGGAVLVLALLIMWGYSAPPLHFKNRPGVDLLIHALFVQTFPYFMGAFVPGGRGGGTDAAIISVALLSSVTAQLEQQVRDFAGDTAAGIRNFATRYGLALTAALLRWGTIALLGVSAGAFIGRALPLILLPIWFIALPALTHRLTRDPAAPRSERLVYASVMVGLAYAVVMVALYMMNPAILAA